MPNNEQVESNFFSASAIIIEQFDWKKNSLKQAVVIFSKQTTNTNIFSNSAGIGTKNQFKQRKLSYEMHPWVQMV